MTRMLPGACANQKCVMNPQTGEDPQRRGEPATAPIRHAKVEGKASEKGGLTGEVSH